MLKKTLLVIMVVVGITFSMLPATAQLPFIQDIAIYSRLLRQVQENSLNSACIRLDGRCLFKLSATDTELLSDRIGEIQERFGEVTTDYLRDRSQQVEVAIRPNGNLQDLYLAVGDDSSETDTRSTERLFTVTTTDARANDVGVAVRAQQLKSAIEQGLTTARVERSLPYLRQQVIKGVIIFALMWLSNFPLMRWIKKSRRLASVCSPQPP